MMVTLSSNADDKGEGDNDDDEDSYNMQCHTCYKTIKKKIKQVIMIIYKKEQQSWKHSFSLFSWYYSTYNIWVCDLKMDLHQNYIFNFTKTRLEVFNKSILRTQEDPRHPKIRT